MRCMRCNKPTDGVELSPGAVSAICPDCNGTAEKQPEKAAPKRRPRASTPAPAGKPAK